MEQREPERRTLNHLRQAIDASPYLQQLALKHLARSAAKKIGVEGLQKLDERIGKRLPVDDICPHGVEEQESALLQERRALFSLRRLVDEAKPAQEGAFSAQEGAFKFLTRTLGMKALRELDRMIGILRINAEKVRI